MTRRRRKLCFDFDCGIGLIAGNPMTVNMKAEQLISPTCTCSIRTACSDHYERIAVLATQLGYPSTVDEIQRRVSEMADSDLYVVFVAENLQHKVIGWIGAYIFSSVAMDKYAEISGLVVDQEGRCQGIGAQLLLAAEEWARTAGCLRLSVRSNVVRERAHQFYLRQGYGPTKTQKTFVKRLDQV
jgi:GNAT superfamily N-acetyltransferase